MKLFNNVVLIICLLMLSFISNLVPKIYAVTQQKIEVDINQIESTIDFHSEERFTYSSRGKPDPFRPLLTDSSEETEKTLNPYTLRLSGIITAGTHKIAIIESEDGTRYILHRDERINGCKVKTIGNDYITLQILGWGGGQLHTIKLGKKEEKQR